MIRSFFPRVSLGEALSDAWSGKVAFVHFNKDSSPLIPNSIRLHLPRADILKAVHSQARPSEDVNHLLASLRDLQAQELNLFFEQAPESSLDVCSFLRNHDLPVAMIDGGIKEYRHFLNHNFASISPSVALLCGQAGVGKTRVMKKLPKSMYLDLEGLANHRGSVFGHVGLTPRSQIEFQSMLCENYYQLGLDLVSPERQSRDKDEDVTSPRILFHTPPSLHTPTLPTRPFVFVECESSRIGHVQINPSQLWTQMSDAKHVILLSASLQTRARRLIEDYNFKKDHSILSSALSWPLFEMSLGPSVAMKLRQKLKQGKLEEVVQGLLEIHYDPQYIHSVGMKHPDAAKQLQQTQQQQQMTQLQQQQLHQLQQLQHEHPPLSSSQKVYNVCAENIDECVEYVRSIYDKIRQSGDY